MYYLFSKPVWQKISGSKQKIKYIFNKQRELSARGQVPVGLLQWKAIRQYCFKNLSRTSDLPISQLGRHSHNWFLMLSWKVGLKVYFWVHLRSFASKIFFHWQAGETTSKFFPLVWEKWMILTCRLSKSVAFCIASVNFEPWKVNLQKSLG